MNTKELTIGFVGNPNCGKTTLFNAYTGANLKVANWPGVTVEKKEETELSEEAQKIKEKGYDDTVVMIVTNSDNYLDIIPSQEKNVTYDETCLTVVLA
jgi:ribosome-binding ATPase YchF (GTP1/OBG family)